MTRNASASRTSAMMEVVAEEAVHHYYVGVDAPPRLAAAPKRLTCQIRPTWR